MTTTVEVLAAAFKDAGTPFIVGHPGGELVELMEAARQRQMRFLLMKQEVAGAMLAATWGDITGSPGICLSTRGPGAANMVNGVAHAFLDRSPLIAITDAYSRPTYETGLRQRINQLAIYEPIVQVEHDDRRQDRAPAGAPRHAHRDRRAAGPGAFRAAAERDHARGRRLRRRAAAACRTGSCRARTAPISSRRSTCSARARRPILMAGLGVLWCRRLGRARRASPSGSARRCSPPPSARARSRRTIRCAPAASSAG